MKKLVKYGVLPACLLMLVACSSKPVVEKPQTKEDKVEQSSESKEEKTKKQIEKDGGYYSSCHLYRSFFWFHNFDGYIS